MASSGRRAFDEENGPKGIVGFAVRNPMAVFLLALIIEMTILSVIVWVVASNPPKDPGLSLNSTISNSTSD